MDTASEREVGLKNIPLKRNPNKVVLKDIRSVAALLAPTVLFTTGLATLYHSQPSYQWLKSPSLYPPEMWIIIFCGAIATCGGIGDWTYHRLYVSAGAKESHGHLVVLATGGVPLALMMSFASVIRDPRILLIPIIVNVLYISVLICYDEFIFHFKRCKSVETLMHRLLVFGNLFAWLAWMHWCFVRGRI